MAGARMTVSSLGFPLGSAVGGALIGAVGVPAMIVVIAGFFLAFAALPVLAVGLSAHPGASSATRRAEYGVNVEREGRGSGRL